MDSGEVEWSHQFPASTTISEADENIIHVCSDDTCYAFNTKDKELKWKFETEGIISAPPPPILKIKLRILDHGMETSMLLILQMVM